MHTHNTYLTKGIWCMHVQKTSELAIRPTAIKKHVIIMCSLFYNYYFFLHPINRSSNSRSDVNITNVNYWTNFHNSKLYKINYHQKIFFLLNLFISLNILTYYNYVMYCNYACKNDIDEQDITTNCTWMTLLNFYV